MSHEHFNGTVLVRCDKTHLDGTVKVVHDDSTAYRDGFRAGLLEAAQIADKLPPLHAVPNCPRYVASAIRARAAQGGEKGGGA